MQYPTLEYTKHTIHDFILIISKYQSADKFSPVLTNIGVQ